MIHKNRILTLCLRLISSVALLAVTMLICIFCGEITIRQLKILPTTSTHAKYQTDDKLSYIPNSKWQYSEPEFIENVKINSIGYRDSEVSLRTPAIVFLGDSQTYGTGVQQGERTSDLIEEYLKKRCGAAGQDVVNISMPGASTRKELAMLEKAIANGLHVEHIFLMVFSNDHSQNLLESQVTSNEMATLNNRKTLKEALAKKVKSLRYESHLLILTLKALSEVRWFRNFYVKSRVLGGWGEILNTDVLYYENPTIRAQVSYTEKYVEEIANIAPTTVVLVPDRYRFDSKLQNMVKIALVNKNIPESDIDFDMEGKLMKNFSLFKKIELIDPTDIFRKKSTAQESISPHNPYYYPINGHLTNKGHALLAASIFQSSEYIQASCTSDRSDNHAAENQLNEHYQVNIDPLDLTDELL